MNGKLYLIPTNISDESFDLVLPAQIAQTINQIDFYIVEEIRTARRFLKKAGLTKAIDDLTFFILNEHTKSTEINEFLSPIANGNNIGLLSEAGCPAVADPGADIVHLAHTKNIQVVPLVGPSSILLALMASGLGGQNFAFNGYLPVRNPERSKQIKFFERRSQQEHQTQIFIEAPYRNMHLYNDLLESCSPLTWLCVAADITSPAEFIKTLQIKDWKKQTIDLQKKPCIFLMLQY